jgi:acylphosphatase
MRQCRHYLVSGRVQGVFFRATTQETARQLGLTGWVRNVRDGRVELVACGEAEPLAALERWLWRGPPHAHVESVTASDVPTQEFADFRVVR